LSPDCGFPAFVAIAIESPMTKITAPHVRLIDPSLHGIIHVLGSHGNHEFRALCVNAVMLIASLVILSEAKNLHSSLRVNSAKHLRSSR
jgi:hypothetical protein